MSPLGGAELDADVDAFDGAELLPEDAEVLLVEVDGEGAGIEDVEGEDMLDEVPASELFLERRLESEGMLDDDAEVLDAEPDGVTIEEILSMVFRETPAFERSEALEYGRPAMIFFAVVEPTPGKVSRSACDAEFKSIFDPGAGFGDDEVEAESDFEDLDGLGVEDALEAADPDAVTIGEIFVMVLWETPAFARSEGLE